MNLYKIVDVLLTTDLKDVRTTTYVAAVSIQATLDYLKHCYPDGFTEAKEVTIQLVTRDQAEAIYMDHDGKRMTLAEAFDFTCDQFPDRSMMVCSDGNSCDPLT